MSHAEWWWLADARTPGGKYAGSLTEDDCEELYALLQEAKGK